MDTAAVAREAAEKAGATHGAVELGPAARTAEGDGIYVTRLHYLSVVNPREGVVTGMTRDGTFRIRGGKRAEPLVNLRFTVSVTEFLAEVPGLTSSSKLVNLTAFYGDCYVFGALVPGIASARFDITGTGSRPGL